MSNICNRFITIIDKKYPIDVALHLLSDSEYTYIVSMITDTKYPSRVCKEMMLNVLNDFNINYKPKINTTSILKDLNIKNDLIISNIEKYQEASSYCKLEKIKDDIEEIKEVMMNNIEEMLKRGDKLEDLIKKSNDLSIESKRFLKASQKVNSCCSIM